MFAFNKNQRDEIENIVVLLLKMLTIKRKKELKWFLEFHVICNHLKSSLWLLQKIYIIKFVMTLLLIQA